jgi:hypothetical protein
MDIPLIGHIQTEVGNVDDEDECNDIVTAGTPGIPNIKKESVKAVRIKIDGAGDSGGSDVLDLKACEAELADTKNRLSQIESTLGLPDDFSVVFTEVTDDATESTELIIEATSEEAYSEVLEIKLSEWTVDTESI